MLAVGDRLEIGDAHQDHHPRLRQEFCSWPAILPCSATVRLVSATCGSDAAILAYKQEVILLQMTPQSMPLEALGLCVIDVARNLWLVE